MRGLEEYPVTWVIGQNIFFIVYFGVGVTGLWGIQIHGIPILSISYIVFLVTMLIFILRKTLCTRCSYYGRRCNTGWGLLSSWMFKKRAGSNSIGVKLAGVTWLLVSLIPIIGISYLLVVDFMVSRLTLLIVFIFLTLINFLIHRESCRKCEMQSVCPMSMMR